MSWALNSLTPDFVVHPPLLLLQLLPGPGVADVDGRVTASTLPDDPVRALVPLGHLGAGDELGAVDAGGGGAPAAIDKEAQQNETKDIHCSQHCDRD